MQPRVALRLNSSTQRLDTVFGVVPLTRRIKTIQVYAPVDAPFVAIEPQFNLNDPFGAEWQGKSNGMVTLNPGQSVTWKVKLVLFTPQLGQL